MAGKQRFKEVNLSVILPVLTCPVCGKEFLKRRDWGCVVTTRGTEAAPGASYVKLCSIPCMRKYEAQMLEADAKHAATLRCCQSYKLHVIDGLSPEEVQKRLGHGKADYVARDCLNAEEMYFRELDWLNKHDWEVAG